jgi:hypothetical protein
VFTFLLYRCGELGENLKKGLSLLLLYKYLHGRTEVNCEKPIKKAGSLGRFEVDNSKIFMLCIWSLLL